MITVNKHWVIVAEWCLDYQGDFSVVGVYHTFKEAQKAFKKRVDTDDRIFANQSGYKIFEDSPTTFDSGMDGYYCEDHISVKIFGIPDEKESK